MAGNVLTRFISGEKGQSKADGARAQEVIDIYKYCAEAKRRREYEWFINDQFYNNNHYLKYNAGTRQIQQIPVSKMADKITINKVNQIVRGVVAFLNKEHPTVGILPGTEQDSSVDRARRMKHLADYWYDHLQLNRKIKEITLDGCKYGVGWAKILWDGDALSPTEQYTKNDGTQSSKTRGEVSFDRVDPFEVYPDPLAVDMSTMRYFVHALPRTIGELKANKRYKNTEHLAPDNKTAASAMKQSQIRQTMTSGQNANPATLTDLSTVIVLEGYKRELDANNEWCIRQITVTETGILLLDEEWPFDSIPFEYYQTEVASGIMNSSGIIRNIRDINRAMNQQYSQILESSRVMGKLNWLVPRGANVGAINDTTGQYIEYDVNPGGAPHQAQPVALPNYIMENANNLERLMDDIAGTHDASNGKSPGSHASGTLVSQLREGDSNNLSMMRDNLDDFLVRGFKKLFSTAKENYTVNRSFRINETDGINMYHWVTIAAKDISDEDDIQVRTGTNMPYSLGDKQALFLDLWKEGVIKDPKVILKGIEMPDVDNMSGTDELDVQRQLQENRDLTAGKTVPDPLISEDHGVHIHVIDQYSKTPAFKELSLQIQGKVMEHRMKHIDFTVQLAQIAASMQFEPIKRSEQINVRANSLNEFTPQERTQFLAKSGVQSDAALIQARGGLFVQDPEQARQQAMLEDNEMLVDLENPMEMSKPMMVSPGDNHNVHLMVHSEAAASPGFAEQPAHAQKFLLDHIKQHEQAAQAQVPAPGLIPNDAAGRPTQPALARRPPAQPAMTQPQPMGNLHTPPTPEQLKAEGESERGKKNQPDNANKAKPAKAVAKGK